MTSTNEDCYNRSFITISYRSEALLSNPIKDLLSIVEDSRRNNMVYGITGVLLFDGTFFMQTIEGPPLKTREVFTFIAADRRHKKVKPFGIQQIEDRDFPDWHMELIGPDETGRIIPDMRHLEFSYSRLREIQASAVDVARRRQSPRFH
ncbi:MAG: BLUF domain-containing protein [Roseovarius sp.]